MNGELLISIQITTPLTWRPSRQMALRNNLISHLISYTMFMIKDTSNWWTKQRFELLNHQLLPPPNGSGSFRAFVDIDEENEYVIGDPYLKLFDSDIFGSRAVFYDDVQALCRNLCIITLADRCCSLLLFRPHYLRDNNILMILREQFRRAINSINSSTLTLLKVNMA